MNRKVGLMIGLVGLPILSLAIFSHVYGVFSFGSSAGGPPEGQPELERKVNHCCSFMLDETGCSGEELPKPFMVDWNKDGKPENCTSLALGDDLQKWKDACGC